MARPSAALGSLSGLLALGCVWLIAPARQPPSPAAGEPPAARVELLDDRQAWGRLPRAVKGGGQPLPAWARALAATLPRTTAAMLELDHLHREGGPLDARLRGRLRWAVARANRCRYGQAQAQADLRRAGLSDPAPGEREALLFADKLARAASTVTDAEVEHLIVVHGEARVVAIVLLVAHATFLDHLTLALDLTPDRRDLLPAPDVRFVVPAPGLSPPAAPRRSPAVTPGDDEEEGPSWKAPGLTQVEGGLARQRDRRPRIRLPATHGEENRWGLLCRTYQPRMAAGWSACVRAYEAEADPDPVLAGSLFWVVAHSLDCFY